MRRLIPRVPLQLSANKRAASAPRVVDNTADADVEVVLCRRAGNGNDVIGAATSGPGDAACDGIVIPGATEAIPITAQLMVRITPHKAGTVHVEGIDLTYRHDLRRGTVHTGWDIRSTTG